MTFRHQHGDQRQHPFCHAVVTPWLIRPPAPAISANGDHYLDAQPGAQSPSTNSITTVVTNSNPYDLVNPRLTATNSSRSWSLPAL